MPQQCCFGLKPSELLALTDRREAYPQVRRVKSSVRFEQFSESFDRFIYCLSPPPLRLLAPVRSC